MNYQFPLFSMVPAPKQVITCEVHGWFDAAAYYTENEIEKMLVEQGYIDCPMCLAEIVGISW